MTMQPQRGGSAADTVPTDDATVTPSGTPDWLEARPTLRDDLVFRPQKIAGRVIYVIEDPGRSKFFRLGRTEYRLAATFDGATSLRDAIARVNDSASSDDDPITEQEACAIFHFAAQNELLESNPQVGRSPSNGKRSKPPGKVDPTAFNPLLLRIPLLYPEPIIARLYPYFGWIFSSAASVAGLVLVAVGLFRLATHWDSFLASTTGIFSPSGQVGLLVCWIALKVIHELAHGLACRRYGGCVRDAGVVLILFLPIAYVDVTSSWRLRSKWQRLHIASAGMQLELYIASIAAVVWSSTGPGALNQACANVVLMAGITTILFNANPLMRFDGYYILTDLLELPNLAATAQAWLRGRCRQLFMGLPCPTPYWPNGRATLIRTYAVLAFAWRILVCAGLITAAACLWHGAGIFLAAFATAVWAGLPVVRVLKAVVLGDGPVPISRIRFALSTGGTIAAATLLLTAVPWPGAIRAAGIVQYEPLIRVRTTSPGFVDAVLVESGQPVESGQVIARLRNDQLQRDLAIQQLAIEASQLKIRRLKQRRKLAAVTAEREQLHALEQQRSELQQQIDGLTITAPDRGFVVSRQIALLPGTYLEQGAEVMDIGDERHKQIQFSISHDELPAFRSMLGKPLQASIANTDSMSARLERIEPRASNRLLDDALGVPAGGSLTVRHRSFAAHKERERTWELLEPHFTGTVPLAGRQCEQVRAGQRAWVSLASQRESLGAHLLRIAASWLDAKAVPTPAGP